MSESNEMTAPLTRAELKEELANYPTRQEFRAELRAEIKAALANYPTREELRAEIKAALANYPTREELNEDLGRHTRAMLEEMRRIFGVQDDKLEAQKEQHASLARRVDRLEVAVFDPPASKR